MGSAKLRVKGWDWIQASLWMVLWAIRWVIRDARTNEPLARDRFVLPGRADTIQNGRVIAEQVSVVLAELSGVVANEVRRLHARRSGGLEQD